LVGNLLFPVGSIYTNATNATNPGTLLGFGTWTAFGAGRVAVGFDAGNALFDALLKKLVVVQMQHCQPTPTRQQQHQQMLVTLT
jgi:hypothetical protein